MRGFWVRSLLPRGLGRWLLAVWLVAAGALPLLGVNNPKLGIVLNLTAIAAGVLLLMDRQN